MRVCSEANAAEVAEHQQTKQMLQQFCMQLRQQLQGYKEAHTKGVMSDMCFQTVYHSLSSELKAKEEKLTAACEAIESAENPKSQFKEALMWVLKSVAEGCSRETTCGIRVLPFPLSIIQGVLAVCSIESYIGYCIFV